MEEEHVHEKKPRLLRLKQVQERVPISRTVWYEGIRLGKYPPPIKFGPRIVMWLEADIDKLIAKVAEESVA